MANDALKQAIANSTLAEAVKRKLLSIASAEEALPSEFFGAGLANTKLKVLKSLHIPQPDGTERVYIAGEMVEPTYREALDLLKDYPDCFVKA